jgi:SH3-like domain-containing protein
MIAASTLLPIASMLKWPATIVGAVLVFGLSTDGTLSLVSSNAHKMARPVQAAPSFSLPPVKQIGELNTFKVEPKAPAAAETAIAATPPASATMQVALRQPTDIAPESMADPLPAGLVPGSIGSSAVNVRAAPSKTSAKIGLLSAGTPVRVGENSGGWVHVWYDGGDGWVYSTYLAGAKPAAAPKRSGTQQLALAPERSTKTELDRPARRATIESTGRVAVREDPQASSQSLFRLEPGERVRVLERQGRWVKVETADGLTGWIKTK